MDVTATITSEIRFEEKRWGFILRDRDGKTVCRQLPNWFLKRDAVASAKFHADKHGYRIARQRQRIAA